MKTVFQLVYTKDDYLTTVVFSDGTSFSFTPVEFALWQTKTLGYMGCQTSEGDFGMSQYVFENTGVKHCFV